MCILSSERQWRHRAGWGLCFQPQRSSIPFLPVWKKEPFLQQRICNRQVNNPVPVWIPVILVSSCFVALQKIVVLWSPSCSCMKVTISFFNSNMEALSVGLCLVAAASPPSPAQKHLSCFILTEPVTDPRSAFPCSGGETHALARLKHYFWDTVSTTSLIINYDNVFCVRVIYLLHICCLFCRTQLQLTKRLVMAWSGWITPLSLHLGECWSIFFLLLNVYWSFMSHNSHDISYGATLCRLAMGCISPRYIYQQIKQYESERTANQSTYWWVYLLGIMWATIQKKRETFG